VAYAIVGWLLLQITDIILPTFEAPLWVAQTITFVLAIGFPIAVILAWAFDVTPQGIKAASDVRVGDAPTQSGGQRFSYISQALVLLAVGFLVVDQYVLEPQQNDSTRPAVASDASFQEVRRLFIPLGRTEPRGNPRVHADIALSPDGRRLAYAIQVDGRSQLYIRELDELTARAIPGTDNAGDPFFSPDGLWLAFNSSSFGGAGELQKVSVRGGSPQTVAPEMRAGWGGFWTPDDLIYFSASIPGGLFRLYRVAAAGGEVELVESHADISDLTHGWSHVLPDGDHVLFSTRPNDGSARSGWITVLSLETGETNIVIENAYNARYVPTGHIAFMRSGSLWAVPFDLDRLETVGAEVPVVNGVHSRGARGDAAYTFSDNGVLIYLPGLNAEEGSARTLIWLDREGNEEALDVEPQQFLYPRLSPDGERLALTIRDSSGNEDVWIYELTRGNRIRLTSGPGSDNNPLWTPDSQRVVFNSLRDDGEGGMFWVLANGTGQEERLTESALSQIPESFSPSEDWLVFRQGTGGADRSLHILSLRGERVSQSLLQTDFFEYSAAISPDGNSMAYTSNESGVVEIYVRPFPNINADRRLVSRGGGELPRWGPDGRELFYRTNDRRMMVASVEVEPSLSVGQPEVLFEADYSFLGYDVSSDGQRFLIVKPVETEEVAEQTMLVVVDNWFEELNRLAPRSE